MNSKIEKDLYKKLFVKKILLICDRIFLNSLDGIASKLIDGIASSVGY
jgi:hypothetical protein